MKNSWLSIALQTLWYSLVLATIMQLAHTLTRVLLSLATASTHLDPVAILGELTSKITWSVLACEAVVVLSILARRRWLLIVFAAAFSVVVGGILGAYFRTIVETVLGGVNDFVWQTVLDSSTMLAAKYSLVGAAVAWANFGAEYTLSRYLKAGFVAATGAALITMTVMNAGWTARLGTVSIDFVFSLGCCAIAWKMRKIAEPLINHQKEIKAKIKNG